MRSMKWRWPMKLMRSMPGVPSATPAHEKSASTGPPSSPTAASIDALSARSSLTAFAPSRRHLGAVEDDDLGAGVLDDLGDRGTHAGGAADHGGTLALVGERVEQAHATTPLTFRSMIESISMPRPVRISSPCSLNSGARAGCAASPPYCTGAAASLNGAPVDVVQSCT